MKCPHCDYKHGHGWEGDDFLFTKGDRGDFWKLPIRLEREESYLDRLKHASVFACPSCLKMFAEE